MERDIEEVRAHAREIAEAHREKGDDYGWFEALYSEAAGDNGHIPWADLVPNKFLVEWESGSPLSGEGKTALVVGCGLGDDANFLAQRGFKVTAFDVSETAIDWAKKLYPSEEITFLRADLFSPPPEWIGSFDLVLEIYTIQALPLHLRERTIELITSFVKDGGKMIVVTRVTEDGVEPEGPPWALTERDFQLLADRGLQEKDRLRFEDTDDGVPREVVAFSRG